MEEQTHGFMANTDYDSPDWDIFFGKDNILYFIEDEKTLQYLTETHEWTKDLSKALSFKTYIKATTYAVENNLSGFVIREHNNG